MADITDRDLETLVVYARLGTQEATASFLGVHKQTVKNRIQSAKKALGAKSTAQALWFLLDGEAKYGSIGR
jgi:DNA-binding CsgD family transcriptional regulator